MATGRDDSDGDALALATAFLCLGLLASSDTNETQDRDQSAPVSDADYLGVVRGLNYTDYPAIEAIDDAYKAEQALTASRITDLTARQLDISEAIAEEKQLQADIIASAAGTEQVVEPWTIDDRGQVQLSPQFQALLSERGEAATLALRQSRLERLEDLATSPDSSLNSAHWTDDGTPLFWDTSVYLPSVYLLYRPVAAITKKDRKRNCARLRSFTDLALWTPGVMHTSLLNYGGFVFAVPSGESHFRLWIQGAVYLGPGAKRVNIGSAGVGVVPLPISTVKKPHDGNLFSAPAIARALGSLKEISSRVYTKKHVWRKARRNVNITTPFPVITLERSDMIAIDVALTPTSGVRRIDNLTDDVFGLALVHSSGVAATDLQFAIQPLDFAYASAVVTPTLKQSAGASLAGSKTLDTNLFEGPLYATRYLKGTAVTTEPTVLATRFIDDPDSEDDT